MSKGIIYLSAAILASHLSLAQPSLRALQTYMDQARTNTTQPIPQAILSDSRNESHLLSALSPYLNDTLSAVRSKAYYITRRIGEKSTNQAVRQTAIDILIQGLRDQDTGIIGKAVDALTAFNKSDFTPAHKNSINGYINLQTPHADKIFMLAGFLEMNDQRGKLNDVINSNAAFKYKWAARLALARMGDNLSIDYILGKLGNAPVNDDLIYDVAPDLIYTRQPEIFKYLEQIIFSDKTDCQSADPDSNAKILCGYRVMEYIAPAIQNYPLPVDEAGDLDVTDYEASLRQVREWFRQNPNYSFRTERY